MQTALDGSRRGGFGMRDGDTRVYSTEIKKDLANVCPSLRGACGNSCNAYMKHV